MGKKVQRQLDVNTEGGMIMKGDNTVFVNGRPIAVTGNPVTSHYNNHLAATTFGSVDSVLVNGRPIVVEGDVDSCGHARINGSDSVFVG
jgi:uncharacterized Zn-binding protein involved in type VI secretion